MVAVDFDKLTRICTFFQWCIEDLGHVGPYLGRGPTVCKESSRAVCQFSTATNLIPKLKRVMAQNAPLRSVTERRELSLTTKRSGFFHEVSKLSIDQDQEFGNS